MPRQPLFPFRLCRLAAATDCLPRRLNLRRNDKRRVIPIQTRARRRDLFRPQRRAVRRRGAAFGGRAEADNRAAAKQHRLVGAFRVFERAIDGGAIVAVARIDIPAVGFEAAAGVVADGERGRAVDRNFVVVEQNNKFRKSQMSGERRRFVADSFHQAAVADDGENAVIDQIVAKTRRQHPLGERHADGVGQALS